MTTEPATIQGKPPERPALTAQKSRSNRALCAGIFGTILLFCIHGAYAFWGDYVVDPTAKHLFLAVVVSSGTCMMTVVLAWSVVPKVEFFQNYLVERSLWGFSRKRRYQEISNLELKREDVYFTFYLKFVFNDGRKITLKEEDIKLGDLIGWLAERGVTAAEYLKRQRCLD